MSDDPILTVPEVALELRCSGAHVYKAIAGTVVGVSALPVIRMGRRRLVRRSSLEVWKRDNETAARGDILRGSLKVDAVGASRSND